MLRKIIPRRKQKKLQFISESMSAAALQFIWKRFIGIGSDDSFTPQQVLDALKNTKGLGPAVEAAPVLFLQQVVPVAEELGLKLAIHPMIRTYPQVGLPRG